MGIAAQQTKARPGYKQTEAGVIPEDWEAIPLGRVGKVIRGASPRPQGDKRYYGGSVPRLMVEDVTRDGKYVTPRVDFLTEEGAKKSRPCKKGTLTIVCSGTVGIPSFLAVNACIHDGFLALVDISKNICDEFVYYQLSSLRSKFENSATHGGVFTNLTTSILEEFQVAMPRLETEQRAIAGALSDVDSLIASLDELVAKKRAVKRGAMQELLTGKSRLPGFSGKWEVKKLGELLAYEQPTTYLVKSTEYSDNYSTPVLTAGKTFILGYTSEETGIVRNLPTIIFDDFTTVSRYVEFPFKAKSSAMKMLRARNDRVTLRFVFERMQLIDFSLGDHKRYWISDYQDLEVEIAEPEEQVAIASVAVDMEADIAALQARRDKTQALKQSMMQQLLTGSIRLI